MSNPEGRPSGIKPRHYLMVLLVAAIIAGFSHLVDRSTIELTFLKVLSIPVLALASAGVDRLFETDAAYVRWTLPFAERVVANAFVPSAGLTFITAQLDSPLGSLVWTFSVMFVVFALMAIYGPLSKPRLGAE